ncbi:MAG TPA: ABC transporter permease [Flavobacteriales bacterium]|nr:ABC transporter permease [Flavobacteriales bacterium]|tara:strand:- start:50688 stop:51554 length:867 start_codon:yes stop_codon:yes gene_type:complete
MYKQKDSSESWDIVITPKTSLLSIDWKEIWRYRDLLQMFVRRDFVAQYKQTILGPLWFLIQPVFTAYTYFLVLNRMGNMPTDGLPPFLFYIAGLTIWNYFATCLTATSDTFISNAHIFGKVYFPRIIVPLSIVVSNLIKFGIQFLLLIFFIIYFDWKSPDFDFHWHVNILLFPIPVLLIGGFALSSGMLVSAMTTKYRDLRFLLAFGVQLLMYASAVIISPNSVPEKYATILKFNPIANIVEFFKATILNHQSIDWPAVIYSTAFLIVFLLISIIIFNKTEKTFMDTV